jgi:hypothetical protein
VGIAGQIGKPIIHVMERTGDRGISNKM